MSVHWCAGMFASGSTWTYNVMRGIAACCWPDRPVRGRIVNTLADLGGLDETAVHIVKSHDLGPEVAGALAPLAESIIVTIRDPRDAVTSLMLYQRYPFDLALTAVARSARFAATLVADERALLLRYESGFPDDPATLDRVAARLGAALAPADREKLFALTRRTAIESLIGGLETSPGATRDTSSGDIFDPETQWHAHHAGRNGEIGRWRHALTLKEAQSVERALADWMARFEYSPAPQASPAYTLRFGSFRIES